MLQMIAYWMPKEGTADSEWEDGAAYSSASGWFAVSDGASTGNSSREWAYTLTRTFVAERVVIGDAEVNAWLERTRYRFDPYAPEFPAARVPEWVRVAGDQRGAHATFLGGYVARGRVEAVAIGDCCLFHIRPDSGEATTFPLTRSDEFGTMPALIASRPAPNSSLTHAVRRYSAPASAGDMFFVASDAFAEWLVGNVGDPFVWPMLAQIGHAGFRDLCRDLRASGRMKNDDVTLLRASVSAANGRAG